MRAAGRGFHTITLGCKLNQFDTVAIEGELRSRGLERREAPETAEVVILNTCTVTHRADSEARRLIRSVRRRNPDCKLLVTGCYAEADPEEIRAIGDIDRVFGNRDKPRLASILDEVGIVREIAAAGAEPRSGARTDEPSPIADRGCDAAVHLPLALQLAERARAFLKIQEGCRLACSYCIIPTVRGPSRSVSPERILASAGELRAAGYREIVLTGVNTGDYGRDLTPRGNLAELLRELLSSLDGVRVRLNSLEPLTVTDELVELMATETRLAPHLQVPLQSGSARVLRAMGRNYRLPHYLERLSLLRSKIPDIGLGADVIVGFPGETADEFDETMQFVAASPLNYLHVFSWSPRNGTRAAELPDRVDGAEIRRRSRALRELGIRMSREFRERFVGHSLEAVLLDPPGGAEARRALTGNFIEVELAGSEAPRGSLVRIRVTDTTNARTRAIPDGTAPARPDAGAR